MTLAPRRSLLLTLVFAVLISFPLAGARDFWAPDEDRYALAAQEMLLDGHWGHPHVNGQPYRDKPPGYFWSAAVLSWPAGRVTELTARLPSLLAGLLMVGLCWDLARRLPHAGSDPGTRALLTGLVLATTFLIAWLTRRVCLDVLLTCCTVGALWSLWVAHERSRRAARTLGPAMLAGVFLAVGVMTKGPVLFLPVAAAAAVLLFHPRLKEERSGGLGLGWMALALVLALAAWLVPSALLADYQPWSILNEHVVERASSGRHHVRPPWHYLVGLPADLAPWSPWFVVALVAAIRQRDRSPADLFLLSWWLVPLVVLSIIIEKRNLYLLTSYPAVALLLGRWLASPDRDPDAPGFRWSGWLTCAGLLLLGVVLLVAGLAWSDVVAREDTLSLVPDLRGGVLGMSALVLVAAGLLGRALWQRWSVPRTATVLALSTGAVFLGLAAVLPKLDPLKSARPFGAAVAELASEGPVGTYGRFRAGYAYYADRKLTYVPGESEKPGALAAWLTEVDRPAHLLIYEPFPEVVPDGARPPKIVKEGRVGSREVRLLRYENRD
ncbi:MAG: glycosyltransferase family 39 protein [Acidobacteriota bacterium]